MKNICFDNYQSNYILWSCQDLWVWLSWTSCQLFCIFLVFRKSRWDAEGCLVAESLSRLHSICKTQILSPSIYVAPKPIRTWRRRRRQATDLRVTPIRCFCKNDRFSSRYHSDSGRLDIWNSSFRKVPEGTEQCLPTASGPPVVYCCPLESNRVLTHWRERCVDEETAGWPLRVDAKMLRNIQTPQSRPMDAVSLWRERNVQRRKQNFTNWRHCCGLLRTRVEYADIFNTKIYFGYDSVKYRGGHYYRRMLRDKSEWNCTNTTRISFR